jgi:hypothetical protein
MVICPVCENQQASGFECDVCGRDLSAQSGLAALPPPPAVAIERLPELEGTPDRVGEVRVERIPELEQNLHAAVQVAPDLTPGLEASALPPVGDIPVLPMDELDDNDRAPDDGVRTAAPEGQVVCRYCKNVQPAGSQCERCGMKLPKALELMAPEIPVEEWVRCRACGAPGPAGERCSECGKVIEVPEGA